MVKKTVRASTQRPIMQLLDVLGQRWTLRILWELRDRRLNFRELRESCDDVSPTSLNQRLKALRALELVDLFEDGYGYTEWGEELGEQLLMLTKWSEKWGKRLRTE